jgi:hypothetical protein
MFKKSDRDTPKNLDTPSLGGQVGTALETVDNIKKKFAHP